MPLIVIVLIVLVLLALFGGCWDRHQATKDLSHRKERDATHYPLESRVDRNNAAGGDAAVAGATVASGCETAADRAPRPDHRAGSVAAAVGDEPGDRFGRGDQHRQRSDRVDEGGDCIARGTDGGGGPERCDARGG